MSWRGWFLIVSLGFLTSCGSDPEAFREAVASTETVEEELGRLAVRFDRGELDDPQWSELQERAEGLSERIVEVALLDLDLDERRAPEAVRFEILVRGVAAAGDRVLLRAELSGAVQARPEGGVMVRVDETPAIETTAAARPSYRDATVAAGLDDLHRAPDLQVENRLVRGIWPGSGAGAADVDGDGDMDLLVLDGRRSILYENDGAAHFVDRTEPWGLEGLVGTGAAFADFDGDGDPDLLVTHAFGGNRFFENLGSRYQDRTESSGTARSPKGSSAAVADYDGDGLLDIYVCNSGDYYKALPDPVWNARDGNPNALFHNQGDLIFVDRAREAGVDTTGWSLAAAFADYDGDGWQDLYVANDFGLNQLFRNRGDGTFEDVTRRAGLGDRGYGMSVTWGDYDGDGWEDLYVSNIESRYAFLMEERSFPLPPLGRLFRKWVIPMMQTMLSGNSLFRCRPDGTFEDVGEELGVWRGGWSWGALFLDYDSDGHLDIYGPNGFLSRSPEVDAELDFWVDTSERWEEYLAGETVFEAGPRSVHGFERNVLFAGLGDGSFREVGYVEGVDSILDARGTVRADFDGDGRPDLYVRNVLQPGLLLLNQRDDPGRIGLRMEAARGGEALGAVVRLELPSRVLTRVVRAHEGYFSSHDPTLLVGLGDADEVSGIEVRWPSGRTQTHGPVPAGVRLDWREGEEPITVELKP